MNRPLTLTLAGFWLIASTASRGPREVIAPAPSDLWVNPQV